MSARKGAQFVPIGLPTISFKHPPTIMLPNRNLSILMMSCLVHLLFKSESSLTKYGPSPKKYIIFVSTMFRFLWMREFRIVVASLLLSLYWAISRKIKELGMLSTWICSCRSGRTVNFESHFPLWRGWRFQLPYHKISVLRSNTCIPSSPAYDILISQPIWYAMTYSSYHEYTSPARICQETFKIVA